MYPLSSALLTDFYQLTMLEAYGEHAMNETAVFELFVRRLPSRRGFLVAAGLEQALEYLETLHFESAELAWLESTGRFRSGFLQRLASLRFTGDVQAMLEGTICFADEPILRVVAPLPQAQLVETRILNLVHYETLIASKAARCVLAAPGKLLVEFGLRRTHGAEAGLLAARASYLAGFDGTSDVLAARLFGIPPFGTMAHSFVQAHDDEALSFSRFARAQPENVTLLLDTYDTVAAARKVVSLAPDLARDGIRIRAVRLDSGDLGEQSRRVREILDQGGLQDVGIFASGNLDEYILIELLSTGAPIDGFGIGTHLGTSADVPHLDFVYKLQEYAGRARRKRSEKKATWPGRKQVYRQLGPDGRMVRDVVTAEPDVQSGEALLRPVMTAGERLMSAPSLKEIRDRTAAELQRLPGHLGRLQSEPPYPVEISARLQDLAHRVDQEAGS